MFSYVRARFIAVTNCIFKPKQLSNLTLTALHLTWRFFSLLSTILVRSRSMLDCCYPAVRVVDIVILQFY